MNHERVQALLEQQFDEGALAPLEQQAVKAHLNRCAQCRERYDRLVRIERGLSQKRVPSAQLERMRALGPPLPAASKRRAPWILWLSGPLAAAAVFLVTFVSKPQIAPRGSEPSGRLAWIRAFESTGDTTKPLGKTLPKASGLAFAYHNLANSPYRFVAIAGLDSAGRVHWYYPEYASQNDTPRSVAIEPGSADRALPQRVFSDHALGALQICALFTQKPLSVVQIDRQVERERAWPQAIFKDCLKVEVVP